VRPAKLLVAARLLLSFLLALVRANIAVVRVVLSPRLRLAPGILRLPVELESDLAITALANMITLTPGTLTVAVSDDRSCLYVHSLGAEGPEKVSADIDRDMVRHLAGLER
jgi:multicomponent Na+:H+ antiporter subunit E